MIICIKIFSFIFKNKNGINLNEEFKIIIKLIFIRAVNFYLYLIELINFISF
jgi:hypothetical protein